MLNKSAHLKPDDTTTNLIHKSPPTANSETTPPHDAPSITSRLVDLCGGTTNDGFQSWGFVQWTYPYRNVRDRRVTWYVENTDGIEGGNEDTIYWYSWYMGLVDSPLYHNWNCWNCAIFVSETHRIVELYIFKLPWHGTGTTSAVPRHYECTCTSDNSTGILGLRCLTL